MMQTLVLRVEERSSMAEEMLVEVEREAAAVAAEEAVVASRRKLRALLKSDLSLVGVVE